MKVTLLEVGKTEADYLKKGIDLYLKRIVHYLPFNEVVIPSLKKTGSLSEMQQKQKEGELILGQLSPTDELILLDKELCYMFFALLEIPCPFINTIFKLGVDPIQFSLYFLKVPVFLFYFCN